MYVVVCVFFLFQGMMDMQEVVVSILSSRFSLMFSQEGETI